MNTIDTKSQVCSLVWANEYKELVSAHGYANNEVTIWKYPTMVIQISLIICKQNFKLCLNYLIFRENDFAIIEKCFIISG